MRAPRKRAPAILHARSGTPAAACRPGDPGDRRPGSAPRPGAPGTAPGPAQPRDRHSPGTGTAGRAADLDKPRTKSAPAGRLDPAQLRRRSAISSAGRKSATVILHNM